MKKLQKITKIEHDAFLISQFGVFHAYVMKNSDLLSEEQLKSLKDIVKILDKSTKGR